MIAEVAPLAVPQFDALLVSLLAIAGAFVALGMVVVLHAVTRATVGGIGGLLAKLPGVGAVVSSPVNAVYHWMNHVFTSAELGLDKVLAHYLHSLGQLIHYFAREIRELSHLVYLLTTVALGTTAIDALTRYAQAIARRVAAVEHSADVALRRIRAVEGSVTARIEHWIDPRIHALEHAIDSTIPYDIGQLRERTIGQLHRLENLWQRVRRLDALLGTAAFTAAVAIALARLDLSWIRCRNWRRIGRGVCGLPTDLLDALLLGVFDAFAVADLCDLTYLATAAADQLRPVLLEFVDVEEALIGCHGNTSPPDLVLPALRLPPVRYPHTFAA